MDKKEFIELKCVLSIRGERHFANASYSTYTHGLRYQIHTFALIPNSVINECRVQSETAQRFCIDISTEKALKSPWFNIRFSSKGVAHRLYPFKLIVNVDTIIKIIIKAVT